MNASGPDDALSAAGDPAAGAAAFTGRRRDRTTKPSVKWADRAAAGLITVGGVGTILAIFGVGAVLVWQVVPLFLPGELATPAVLGAGAVAGGPGEDATPAAFRVDEFVSAAAIIGADGVVAAVRADDGTLLGTAPLAPPDAPGPPTAAAAAFDTPAVALGFADGTVRVGAVDFVSRFRPAAGLPAGVEDLNRGEFAAVQADAPGDAGAVAEATAGGRFRVQTVRVAPAGDPLTLGEGPVRRLTVAGPPGGPVVAGWTEGDGLALLSPRGRAELTVPADVTVPAGPPAFVRIGDRAADVTAAWPDGTAVRFNTRNKLKPTFSDAVRLVPEGRTLTALEWVVGRGTLLAGDDAGGLTGWFPARTDGSGGGARSLTAAKRYPAGPAAVAAVRGSGVARLAAVGYADGTVRVIQTTTEAVVGETGLPAAPLDLFLTPRGDRSYLFAALPTPDGPARDGRAALARADFDAGSPDATLASLLLPVWYEGGPGPEAKWQSTGGSVGVEPKYGLWPLIFGTLKATFYSMLFAAPLALLAAVHTGEYLPKPVRAKLKPAVEVMAGLPSVVLGFIAAVTFSPYVSDHLVAVLCAFVTVPATVLAGAYAWQALPQAVTIRRRRWRLALCAACLPVGVWLADVVAPAVEAGLFAGDVKLWLDGRAGTPVGAWMFLTLPLSAAAVAFASARGLTPLLVRAGVARTRGSFAAVQGAQFAAGFAATLLLAYAAAWGLTGLGTLIASSPLDRGGRSWAPTSSGTPWWWGSRWRSRSSPSSTPSPTTPSPACPTASAAPAWGPGRRLGRRPCGS